MKCLPPITKCFLCVKNVKNEGVGRKKKQRLSHEKCCQTENTSTLTHTSKHKHKRKHTSTSIQTTTTTTAGVEGDAPTGEAPSPSPYEELLRNIEHDRSGSAHISSCGHYMHIDCFQRYHTISHTHTHIPTPHLCVCVCTCLNDSDLIVLMV